MTPSQPEDVYNTMSTPSYIMIVFASPIHDPGDIRSGEIQRFRPLKCGSYTVLMIFRYAPYGEKANSQRLKIVNITRSGVYLLHNPLYI